MMTDLTIDTPTEKRNLYRLTIADRLFILVGVAAAKIIAARSEATKPHMGLTDHAVCYNDEPYLCEDDE